MFPQNLFREIIVFPQNFGKIRGTLSRKERGEKWAKKDKKRIELGKMAVIRQNYFEKGSDING
jgi:hypothetical protein